MKRIWYSVFFAMVFIAGFSQAPSSFNYQAIVRNGSGNIIPNKAVSFRLSILEGSADGPSVFTETHLTSTDDFGLIHLKVGKGELLSCSYN